MIGIAFDLVLAVVAMLLVVCTPGWAIARLLELQLRIPSVAMLPAAFTFGLATWSVLLAGTLALGMPILATLAAHAIVTAVLVAWLVVRERARGHAVRGLRHATGGWTIVVIGLCVLAAAILRTRIAFDTLFHVGMVRRLAELDSPNFENLDRIVGAGINPAYVLPSWQGAMAAIAALTGLDPATVVEAMAIVGVLLAACCAAALGRVVSGTVVGELAAVATYAFVRVVFPRRELEGDGVAYAALPGNIALDVMLVLVLVAALVLLRSRAGSRRDGAVVALAAVATILLVVLHANYVVYLAVIGLGATAWLLAAGPWSRTIARRLGFAAAAVAVPGLVALAALLPLLMLLEHFGAPLEARIDYHLVELGGVEFIRPGHLYDWFAAPGLVGILLLPWAAWIARGASRALVAGGSLAVIAFSLVPPLVDLLATTGSLTLSLRLPRPLGILLVAAAAIALPDLVARLVRLADGIGSTRGPWLRRLVLAAPFVAVLALVAAYGYPLVRREPAQYGWDWPTLLALALLLVVAARAVAHRRRAGEIADTIDPASPAGMRPPFTTTRGRDRHAVVPTTGAMALALLALAAAMLPSGLTSMRRAAWQSRELVAAYRADDLRCLDGVQSALREIPAGDVLLTDPVTAYDAQALAPVYVVGDYKVWNGSTDSERIDERIRLLNATFQAQRAQRAGFGLARLSADFQGAWLLVARGEVVPPIGSELYPYDAAGVRALVDRGLIGAELVAEGPGRLPADAEPEERAACDLQLWRLDGGERDLELRVDEHGDLVIEDLHHDAAPGQDAS